MALPNPTAPTRASLGYLGTFEVGDNASPIGYTPMLEIKSMTPNWFTIPVVDATHLQSPNATEEKLPGLIRPGTLSMTGNFVADATQLNIRTVAKTRTPFSFRFTIPVDSISKIYTATGRGFFSRYDHGAIEASRLTEFTCEIEITGDVTESTAAA